MSYLLLNLLLKPSLKSMTIFNYRLRHSLVNLERNLYFTKNNNVRVSRLAVNLFFRSKFNEELILLNPFLNLI